jgi:hypothetical protein
MNVYQAISAVQKDLSAQGISKDRKNTQGSGYAFRGIDDVYNALSPFLAKHGLCILPRVLNRESVERQSKAGGALFYITVEVEFDLVAADGSKHTIKTFGEAMDSGDKATNKAMSAAYKYACMQSFCIPTEGDNDADTQTHQVASKPPTLVTIDMDYAVDEMAAQTDLEALKACFAKWYKSAPDSQKEVLKAMYDGIKVQLVAISNGAK